MISNFFLTFLESLMIFLIKMVIILAMPAKMSTPCLFEIPVFRNKSYDVIIPVHDVTNKILLCESNCSEDMVM